ncbi:MAG: glutamate-1-semialdehyde 2,1-aminomutase [Candidatus Bathyarchaeia archaeon]|jgi:glutamate-1-semialdehyde 2,1-aminomutase
MMEGNTLRRDRSNVLYDRIRSVVPGGVHSNIRIVDAQPLWFKRAQGSKLWDVDGNEYIDCVINMAALILGHGDERVTKAVMDQLDSGMTCGVETELNVKAAESIKEMVPCAESVKFSNSGTEAVMKAMMVARGYTGRQKMIKLEGGYNGSHDAAAVSFKPSLKKAGPRKKPRTVQENLGLLKIATESTIVMPFNDLESAEKIIRRNRKELAAVVVEPIMFNLGCVRPEEGYLKGLREITHDNDVLLIFDEVISGFRVAPGGAQEYYGVVPDMATYAKAIANGFPMSAVAGRADIMKVTEPGGKVGWAGVYNSSQTSVAASVATLDILKDGQIQRKLNAASADLEKKFARLAEEEHVEARLQSLGGQFQAYFTDDEVKDYRSAAKADSKRFMIFQAKMLQQGIYLLPIALFHHGLVAAHSEKDIENILAAMRVGLQSVRQLGS